MLISNCKCVREPAIGGGIARSIARRPFIIPLRLPSAVDLSARVSIPRELARYLRFPRNGPTLRTSPPDAVHFVSFLAFAP